MTTTYGEAHDAETLTDAQALDALADLFSIPEWNIGDSMGDFLDCIAHVLRKVRPFDGWDTSEDLLAQTGQGARFVRGSDGAWHPRA